MQIAEVVALPPACCAICKSGNQAEPKPFIDTQAHYAVGQRLDRIYICFNCVKVLANLHDFISPDEAEVKDHKIESLEEQVQVQEEQIKALEDVKVALGILKAPKPKAKPKAEPAPVITEDQAAQASKAKDEAEAAEAEDK
jgi:hypothetical protein